MSFMFRRSPKGLVHSQNVRHTAVAAIDWCRNIRNDNAVVLPANSPTIHCCGQPIRRGGDSAISRARTASIQLCRNVLLRQLRLIQGNQLRGLTDAEPGLSYLSSSLLRSAGSWDPTRSRSSFWCCTPSLRIASTF
jgi:hypothetical protein